MKKVTYKRIAYMGLMSALVLLCTLYVKIPVGYGYLNAGTIIIIVASCIFSPVFGGIVGSVGSSLADFLGGYSVWVPSTIIIKFLIGVVVGIGYYKKGAVKWLLYTVAGVIAVGGYYIAEGFIFGNWVAPIIASVPYLFFEYALSLPVGLYLVQKLKAYNINNFID
ncbi:MAG: hypothetical protein BWY15_00901 [Firmicutes bacterium ADurb.Bin193]|nr:MAG: hypothetical protein BWY15_00901 [Firmicutes bacterium ADurb.Bin193]